MLARYRAEIDRSRKWRNHEQYDQLWDRLVDMYRGRHFQRWVDEDRIVVNMAKATIDVIAPSIAVNNPKITVNARREDSAPQAEITEAVVNYYWRHGKFQKEIRRAVNDMLMVGHGWVKVGYAYSEPPPESGIASQEELDKETVPDEQSGHTPDMEHAPEEHPYGETLTPRRVDRPFVERVSFRDIFVDPDATVPADLRWICQRVRRPVADVKRDTRYTNEGRRLVQAETRDRWDESDLRTYENKGDIPGGYVDVYELYDLVSGQCCTFTRGHGDHFLVKPKPSPLPFANPFIMFRDYDVPDQFYPMGELEAVEVLQHELNEIRTAHLNHLKRYNPKWLYREDAFPDQQAVNALKDDAYNSMVPVDATGLANLADAVVAMPTTQPPPALYDTSDVITNDINTITGVSDYMRGQMPDIRRTATEAGIIADAAQSRAADKLANIEQTLAEVAERVIQVLQAFTTGDQVIRISGPNGLQLWVHYEREYIQGEFDYEVEAGSTQPMNETFRRQSAMQMGDVLAPFMDIGVVNPENMLQYLLQYGFGIKNAGHLIQAPPPPAPPDGVGAPMEPDVAPPPPQALPPAA